MSDAKKIREIKRKIAEFKRIMDRAGRVRDDARSAMHELYDLVESFDQADEEFRHAMVSIERAIDDMSRYV